MLGMPAKTVFIDPAIYQKESCRKRLERMLPNVRCSDIRALESGTMQSVFDIGKRRHGKDSFGDDAVLVFTTFDENRSKWFYHVRDEAVTMEGACQSGVELNIVDGCIFRCAYCGFGRRIVFYLDVERFISGLDDVFASHPSQRLYKFSNMTDLPPFEPELDVIRPMVERFAREDDRYLMLFTKSDNVGFLKNLEHRGHTIISWSITCDTASRVCDSRTATMRERIEAMEAMQAAGYRVRARLSPIVPVSNWREEYAQLFEMMFARVKPDVVTLELLGWMDIDDLLAIMDRTMLDNEALNAAEARRAETAGHKWGPFTQETHEEVYRFCIETVQKLSPETPVSICHGTPSTWSALGKLMKMAPDNYICNCGPFSAPGGTVYDAWHCLSDAP